MDLHLSSDPASSAAPFPGGDAAVPRSPVPAPRSPFPQVRRPAEKGEPFNWLVLMAIVLLSLIFGLVNNLRVAEERRVGIFVPFGAEVEEGGVE